MNNGRPTAKIIISALAAVSVILLAVIVLKFTGVFGGKEAADAGNDVANYGMEETNNTMTTTASGSDVFLADNSTIEMDEIPSNADVYAEEAAD